MLLFMLMQKHDSFTNWDSFQNALQTSPHRRLDQSEWRIQANNECAVNTVTKTCFLVMNSMNTRKFLHNYDTTLHMSLSVSPPVPLVEPLLVRRLLSSLELPSLPLATVCWGLVSSCISNDLPTNSKQVRSDQMLQKGLGDRERERESPQNVRRNKKEHEQEARMKNKRKWMIKSESDFGWKILCVWLSEYDSLPEATATVQGLIL